MTAAFLRIINMIVLYIPIYSYVITKAANLANEVKKLNFLSETIPKTTNVFFQFQSKKKFRECLFRTSIVERCSLDIVSKRLVAGD